MAKKRKEYLEDYLDHDEFEYDYKSDPVYQAMKKQYLSEAEKTAEDVLGKYAVSSGGGTVSSAAIAAASNASNAHKSKLSEAIPALYDLAWEMYQSELENKKDKYEAIFNEDAFTSKNLKNENDGAGEETETGLENENTDDGYIEGGGHNNEKPYVTSPIKNGVGEKEMESGIFDMTKKLIENLVASGDVNKAKSMYNMYVHSMSEAQRKAVEKIIAK